MFSSKTGDYEVNGISVFPRVVAASRAARMLRQLLFTILAQASSRSTKQIIFTAKSTFVL